MKPAKLNLSCIGFIVISLVFVGISYTRVDPETCVGAWLFDEGNGNKSEDFSGNGNDGILTNGPEWTDGQFGDALDFAGGVNAGRQHVLCGKDASINSIADAITIVALVYPRQESNYEYIVSNDRDCCGQFKGYSLSLGYLNFQIWDENSAAHNVNLAKKPSLNKWCHLAGTFDGAQLKIYLDGVLSNSTVFAGKIGIPASYEFAIGGLGFNPATYNINGIIDEVAVFNVALEENDIERIMTVGLEEALGGSAVSPSGKLTTSWGQIKTSK